MVALLKQLAPLYNKLYDTAKQVDRGFVLFYSLCSAYSTVLAGQPCAMVVVACLVLMPFHLITFKFLNPCRPWFPSLPRP